MESDKKHRKELPEFTPDYIDQLFSGTNSKPQPQAPVTAPPPEAQEQPQQPRKRVAPKKQEPRQKKLLTYISAAVAVVALCLLAWLLRNPFSDISELQWETLCRDAYDGLYAQEQMHFTQTTVRSTATATTTVAVETWFSGENFYRIETDKDGKRTAYLANNGTYYRNTDQELAAGGWNPLTGSPWSSQSEGAWEETDYVFDGLERKGKEMDVVFSKNAGAGKQLRVFYLRFRFDTDLNLKSVQYSNVVYEGSERDPEQIKTSVSDEYTFHPSTMDEIKTAIDTPLKLIAEYNRESKKWTAIAGAIYEELCTRTLIHYTSEQIAQEYHAVPASTTKEEGWICETDSVTHTKTERKVKTETGKKTITLEQVRLRVGSESYTKVIRDGETEGWEQGSREPSMHGYYGALWARTYYAFRKVVSDESGTVLTFSRPSTLPGSDNLIPGITVVTFYLDKEIDLYKITVSRIDGDLETEPYTVTQYHIHDVTEAQAREEIDKYHKMAADNS